jgi:hypothetical protein
MKNKFKYENENFILLNELRNEKKNIIRRKTSTNSNFQKKEAKLLATKLSHLDSNSNNFAIPFNIRPKMNLNLLPIKKQRSKKESEINTFSLFFKGNNNNFSKNEVNLITTQYNYGNNQLLIHKTSKDFTSKKIKIHSLNNNTYNTNININNTNNNTTKDEIEEKKKSSVGGGPVAAKKFPKRTLILNDLKNRKHIISELKNIKEIRHTIYENQLPPQQNIDINKIANNISTKKLPGLNKIKNNINLIDYLNFPPRNKLITPLLQNKSNYIRKKSEKITRIKKEEKEKDDKNITFGHKIHWKKVSLLKEGENCFIYKAFNISNGFIFIVKEYKIKNNESRKKKKLFYNEARFLKMIEHKNIVNFIDAEVIDNNYFYIYLNFIGGYNLKDFYSKVGFFTKSLLKGFIEQIIYFLDYMKLKGLVYNNFSFNHFMFDLDGTIKIIDFSKAITQNDIIINNYVRHNEDVDFCNFKNMILNIVYYEKSNNFNKNEFSNDICNFCNFLETSLINISSLSEFKSNYFCKNKEETIYIKNSSINIIN